MIPELVIFDCDGVLIDSEVLSCQALADGLAEVGVSLTMDEVFATFVGTSTVSAQKIVQEKFGIQISPEFWEKKRVRTKQLYAQSLKPITGIADLLDLLSCKKCVASSTSPEGLKHSLGLAGLWDLLAPHIFSATQVKNGKPAPDLFLFAAEHMGVAPENCLVIEDSVPGVRAAKAANMRVFGFTGGSHCLAGHAEKLRSEGADKVFVRMSDIAALLCPSSLRKSVNV